MNERVSALRPMILPPGSFISAATNINMCDNGSVVKVRSYGMYGAPIGRAVEKDSSRRARQESGRGFL